MLRQAYPWASLPSDTTICDVGGGTGHVMLSLCKSFPALKIVVQDLSSNQNDAERVCEVRAYLRTDSYDL